MYDIKFDELKKRGYGEDSRKQIAVWEDRVLELAEQENFRNHPTTQKLAIEAQNQIEAIDNVLKNDEELSELERKALIKAKKIHLIYLTMFTRDGSQEIEAIAKLVNDELL